MWQESFHTALNSLIKFWARIKHFFSCNFRCDQNYHTFVVILYQKDEILQKFPASRKVFLSKKKKFCLRDFVPHERISCFRTKFPVTGRNFLLQDEISCHRTKFHVTVRNFKWCIIICIRNVVIFILI